MAKTNQTSEVLGKLHVTLKKQQKLFLMALEDTRPSLHRFCTRMTGSALDGEDVVQEVMSHAFFHLSELRDSTRLEPWLFRIAHNKSIDFLRRKRVIGLPLDEADDITDPTEDPIQNIAIDDALTTLVVRLPPMERASILLKDVLDYPLADIAEIVGSSIGGVKAALHRGREKLKVLRPPKRSFLSDADRVLIQNYVDRFNSQDWEGVLALVHNDARLRVIDRTEGNAQSIMRGGYFRNYLALPWKWKLELGVLMGEEVVLHFRQGKDGVWHRHTAIRIECEADQVVGIDDYVHVPYLASLDD